MNITITRFGYQAPAGLTGLAHRFRLWRARRAEIGRITAELSAYTERQLADLGISRSDIPTIAASQYRRF